MTLGHLLTNEDQKDTNTNNCYTNTCRGCNNNLSGNDPASQYQRQKLIQNTVRVKSSLYTMNLAALSSYQRPLNVPQLVEQAGSQYIVPSRTYWNQMSDRARPSVQNTKVASGSTYHSSSTRHSITRHRPGALSPGGIGVDIKHNSYERYLLKLKGKGPLRRGKIPPTYGLPIPFNRAEPIYGGKTVKTGIISACSCDDKQNDEKFVYNNVKNNIQDELLSFQYTFNKGDYVWAKQYENSNVLYKGQIIDIANGLYTVKFEDVTRNLTYCDLLVYFDCDNCIVNQSIEEEILSDPSNVKELQSKISSDNNIYCQILNLISVQGGLF